MPMDFDLDDDSVSDVFQEPQMPIRQAKESAPPKVWRAASPEPDSQEEFEEQMSEVEKRLEMAQYYRLVLNDTIFNDPDNVEVADRVELEIREFVRGRMSALVGVGEPAKNNTLSDEELVAIKTLAQPEVFAALKALAARLLKKPEIVNVTPVQDKPKSKVPGKSPSLKKIVRSPKKEETPEPEPAPAPKIKRPTPEKAPRKGRQQEKVFKTVISENGDEVKLNVTPQAQPVGVKPLPTPIGKQQIEANSAMAARQQAIVAVQNLENQLTGKLK